MNGKLMKSHQLIIRVVVAVCLLALLLGMYLSIDILNIASKKSDNAQNVLQNVVDNDVASDPYSSAFIAVVLILLFSSSIVFQIFRISYILYNNNKKSFLLKKGDYLNSHPFL